MLSHWLENGGADVAKAKNKKEIIQSTGIKEKTPMIYVGPGAKNSILSTFSIFSDGIPAEFANDDILKHLFVTPDKLNEARRAVGKKGTALNTFYQKAVEKLKGENK